MTKHHYKVYRDNGEKFITYGTLESDAAGEELTTRIAESFHDTRDGWAYAWPLTFEISGNVEFQNPFTVRVDREHRPVFTAERVGG